MNYIVAQLLGAGAAALCLKAVFGHSLLAGVTRVHMGYHCTMPFSSKVS